MKHDVLLQIESFISTISDVLMFVVFDTEQTNDCFLLFTTGSHVETQGLPLADIIAVFVGAILLSLAVAAVVGVIYCFCRNHKLKRQKCKYNS